MPATNTITKKSNLFNSTNLIVGLSLVAILLLVFLKNKNFELFATSSTSPATTKAKLTTASATTTTKSITIPATTTIPLLNNDVIQNSALVNFINRFIVNKNQQNVYTSTLADRQKQINDLSEQVINLINPTA